MHVPLQVLWNFILTLSQLDKLNGTVLNSLSVPFISKLFCVCEQPAVA